MILNFIGSKVKLSRYSQNVTVSERYNKARQRKTLWYKGLSIDSSTLENLNGSR